MSLKQQTFPPDLILLDTHYWVAEILNASGMGNTLMSRRLPLDAAVYVFLTTRRALRMRLIPRLQGLRLQYATGYAYDSHDSVSLLGYGKSPRNKTIFKSLYPSHGLLSAMKR